MKYGSGILLQIGIFYHSHPFAVNQAAAPGGPLARFGIKPEKAVGRNVYKNVKT
jgi:hypothetical protein